MIVAGWADGYRNNSFRTVAALGAAGVPHRLLAGPWAHADPTTAMPGPRIDLDAEMAALVRPLAARPAGDARGRLRRLRAHLDPARSRTSTCTRATGSAAAVGAAHGRRRRVELDGPRVARRSTRRRHRRLDRLCRPPAVGAVRRPAARRRPLADLGPRPAGRGRRRASRGAAAGVAPTQPAGLAVGQALRRLPRRHVGAGHPRHRSTWPSATASTAPRAAGARARPTTSRCVLDACAYEWSAGPAAPGQRRRRGLAQHDRAAGPGDPHRALRLGRAAAAGRLRGAGAGVRRRAPSTRPRTPTASPGRSRDVLRADHDLHGPQRSRRTTCRTTARRRRTTAGEVGVDRRTFAQWPTAETTCRLAWPDVEGPGVDVRVVSTLRVDVGPDGYDVVIDGRRVRRRGAGRPPGVARAPAPLTPTAIVPDICVGDLGD